MSTTTAKLNIDASQALAALNRVDKQIQGLGKSFGALQKVIGGIAIGAFIRNAFTMADAIDDISKATGIAIENVMGFGRAVQANGGTIEDANNALFKLTQNIGEAAAGSASAQQSFREVGVSLQDLATLSEQQILEKVIKGLGEIPDKAKQARLSVELMGKGFKGLDLSNLGKDYQQAVIDSAKYAQATKSAADANQNLQAILGKLANELLLVLKPISDMVKKIDANSESFMRWFNAIKTVAGVLFTIFGIVVPLARAFLALRAGAAVAATAIKELGSKDFPRFLDNVKGWITNLPKVFQIVKEGIAKAETGIKTATKATDAAKYATRLKYWEQIAEKLTIVKQIAMGAATGIATVGAAIFGYATGGPSKEEQEAKARLEKYKKDREAYGAGSGPQGPRRMSAQQREVIDALAKQGQEIRNVTKAYQENQNQLIANINTEARYLQMSDDAVEIARVQEDIYTKAIDQIRQLEAKKASLSEQEKLLAPIIEEQIKTIEKSITVDQARAETAIKNLQAIRKAQEDFRKSLEDLQRAFSREEALQDLQDELSLIGLYGEELEKQTVILQAQKALREEMQRLSVELLNLDAQRVQLGEEAYQRERARVIQQMMDVKSLSEAKIAAYEEEVAKKQKIDESYAEGASRALKDIADQYKPINMAQEAVRKGWGAIENAVDTFVDTGKFKFSDFARSVIADLAKMIAKAMIFKAISAALGAFGLKLPGMATGGPVEAGKGYIVGEKGPELFVPPGSGKIVPNKDLQGNGKGTGAISAPVTNNYNTYNISALDAKSVAQMFAENRKAIFGANKMAEREMSYVGAR